MLNKESLSQLKGLKSAMEADKERAEAVVKGTQARYGFAVLDDSREVFIPPQEMLKVFPGDRVRICIRPTKDNKTVADVERLIDSPLDEFTGRCVRKGKAFFVAPDLAHISRWLFIPPHARNGVKENDYVRCAILRHPIKDGKPQAKVLNVLGNDATPGIENLYCMTKHGLASDWSVASKKELEKTLADSLPLETEKRRDLTGLEFVSIDAAKTQDIDDALYAEISDGGWTLFVAIADPSPYIRPGSSLAQDIAARGTSFYFHGDVLPMLPEQLSQDTCALSEGADRAALVCKIAISDSGEVGDFEFMEATVHSRAKLSYYAVERYLNGQYDDLMSHATPLEALYQVYRALREAREERHLVMEDRREFRWILGENKQIDSVERSEKLLSQKLVEECMIAANRCAAQFLETHNANGPFVTHPGFRSDRLDELKKFLDMHSPELATLDPKKVQDYRDIVKGLSSTEHALPLRPMINRLLTRAELSVSPSPHMGMALHSYTNCTSPLRKYVDFLVHQQIKALLNGEAASFVTDELLDNLKKRLATGRAATLEAERWLASRYIARLATENGAEFKATVSHVSSGGFNVRLVDNGLEGFADLRQDPEKFSYDKWTASLTSSTRRFALQQPVTVKYLGIDENNRYNVLFEPLPECGLKPPKDKPGASAAAVEEDHNKDQ